MFYLYILCSLVYQYNYVGVCKNPEKRLLQHNKRESFPTKPYCPFIIIYQEKFPNKSLAYKKEKWIKTQPKGRIWKKKIIDHALRKGL